jgi:hypothetical protein
MIGLALILGFAGNPDVPRLVRAIEAVENSSWASAGGGLQWSKAAWSEETKEEFNKAANRTFSRELAEQRLTKFIRRLHVLGIQPTPYLLALMWNRGWSGALARRKNPDRDDYGQRVENYFIAYET